MSRFLSAVYLYESKQYAASYKLFDAELKNKRSPEGLFNFALCHIAANEHNKAAQLLAEAEQLAGAGSLPGGALNPKDFLYDTLLEGQLSSDSYLAPMVEGMFDLDKKEAQHKLWRLMADVYAKLEEWGKVREIASRFAGKTYLNIAELLKKAR